jgi:hypothetical protein
LICAIGLARAHGVVLPLPPADQEMITTQLGSGVVGQALPSSPNSTAVFNLAKMRRNFAGPFNTKAGLDLMSNISGNFPPSEYCSLECIGFARERVQR